jgi:hypothetical protein
MVGDSAQAIYGWRGARDVMTGFDATHLTLTRSFRFGPLLAEQANRWLALADAPIRLTGTETIPTKVGLVSCPDAVLCRTNIGAMTEVMGQLKTGRRVALARGGQTLHALARSAQDLKEGRAHPIPNWFFSLHGESCRSTRNTIPPAATYSRSWNSSTPTGPKPSWPPSMR